MKTLTLILASVLLMQTEGYLIKVQNTPTSSRIVPVGWVHIQKLLLPLFENVCEESTEPTVVRLSEEFKQDPTNGNYLKPEVIDNLFNLKASKGLLAKGDIFTEYDSDHMNELTIVYEVLYYAKDFDTFYKAACWARQNLNCGLFVDAIYLAVISRRDTEKVTIPPPYELLPNYFIRKDFIIKASSLIRGEDIATDTVRNEGNAYILDVNYTANFYDDGDDKLAYFHEDVALNSYYFLTKLKKFKYQYDIRYQNRNNGEYIYSTMKQMMTRYNLERYSHGLPELEGINWDNIYDFTLPYDPMLVYSNGNTFNERTTISNNKEIITLLKTIESNLQAVVIHMRDNGYKKSEILNHIMGILVTNDDSYDNLAIKILSGNDAGSPSVLGHYLTIVRDPIFWRINKKIVDMVDNALSVLPSYTVNQLYFPGVEIQNIEVKKLMTLFDNFEFDVTDALQTDDEETKFQIKIAQNRLNHKPFAFKINIASQVAQKALVKIYIGPKVMPGEHAKNKKLFMFLDSFQANLKIGTNILSRNSNEMTSLSEDLVSLGVIHKNVLDTEFGINALTLKSVLSQTQFPSRLILPKGTSDGLPLQLFVFVAPYVKSSGSRTNMEVNLEALFSPGYPLDLDMETPQLFSLPNAFVKDIVITHKSENTNAYKKPINNFNEDFNDKAWSTDEIDYNRPSGLLKSAYQPTFNKKKFDYQSKKNQFGKRPNFSYKRTDNNNDVNTPEKSINTEDFTAIKFEDLPKNTEIINNIYITPQKGHQLDPSNQIDKVEKHIDENYFKFVIDKDNVNKDFQKEVIEEVKKEINVIPYKGTEDKNIINNAILDNNFSMVEKAVENTIDMDKDTEKNTFNNEENEEVINNLDDITIKETKKVPPHGLLTMPRKKNSNIFKIVFAQKPDTDGRVYI